MACDCRLLPIVFNSLSQPLDVGRAKRLVTGSLRQALIARDRGSLRDAAALSGHTVAQLVINWTINQPGITSTLCGAKRRWQIEELAGAMGWTLSDEQLAIIDAALAEETARTPPY